MRSAAARPGSIVSRLASLALALGAACSSSEDGASGNPGSSAAGPGAGGSASGQGASGSGASSSGGSGGNTSSGGAASGGAGGGGGGAGGGGVACDRASPQPTRLRITSHCAETVWIQSEEDVPVPPFALAPDTCHDVPLPETASPPVEMWPKLGCDASGEGCLLGESALPCPPGGCHPDVDSKIEVNFADAIICPEVGASSDCLSWYSAAQTGGYTLPFRIVPKGPGSTQPDCVPMECGALDLADCPSDEDLSQGGQYPALTAVDLRILDPGDASKVLGCMSPCEKLTYEAPYGLEMPTTESPAAEFCCPSPPISEAECNAGPVVDTQYVTDLSSKCPKVHAYAYDDADSLHACPAQTQFELVLCPDL